MYPQYIHNLSTIFEKISPQFFHTLCYKAFSIKQLKGFKCTVAESLCSGIGWGYGLRSF